MTAREDGQAALEVVATVPLMIVAVLVIVQLVGFVRATIAVTDEARARLVRTGVPATTQAERRVSGLLPGVGPFRIRVRATTELP